MQRRLSFRQRLKAGLLLTALAAIIILVATVQALVATGSSNRKALALQHERRLGAERLWGLAEARVSAARAVVMMQGDARQQEALAEARADFLSELERMRSLSPDATDRSTLDQAAALERQHLAVMNQALALQRQGAGAEVLSRFWRDRMRPLSEALDSTVHQFLERSDGETRRESARAEESARRAVRRIAIIGTGGVVLALVASWLLGRTLVRVWDAERRAARAAEAANRRYVELLEGLGGAIAWEALPEEERFTFVSPQAASLLGWNRLAPLNRMEWHRLVPPEDQAEVAAAIEAARRRGGEQRVEHHLATRNGQRLWFQTVVRLARDETGRDLLRGLSIDITRLRDAEDRLREHARQQGALADLGRAALTDSREELVQRATHAVRQLLGLDAAFILACRPEGLLLRASTGLQGEHVRIPVELGSPWDAVLAGSRSQAFDGEARPLRSELLPGEHLAAALLTPLDGEGQRYGVLGGASRTPRVFTADDQGFLEGVASVVATGLARHHVDRRLRESEQRLRLVVEGVADHALYMLDAQGRVLSWNPGAERLKGYRADEIVGRHLSVFFTEEDRRAGLPAALLAEAARQGRVQNSGWRLRGDGERYYAELTLSALRDDRGELVGFVEISRDITERERAEGVQRLLVAAGESLSQSSSDFDRTLEVVARLPVPHFCDLCVVTKAGENRSVERIVVWADQPDVRAQAQAVFVERPLTLDDYRVMASVLESGETRLVEDLSRDDGTPGPEEQAMVATLGVRSAIMSPLKARGRTLGTMVFSSLRGRRRFGAADVPLATELARRAALALDNALLLREAQEAVHARDQFLSIASHELKTPLTALRLEVASLARAARVSDGAGTPPRLERKLALVERQSTRLGRLFDQLLDISRITQGRLDLALEELDAGALVESVCERLRGDLERSGSRLELRREGPLAGLFDRGLLEQVVLNLVVNAIKYGEGKPVEVSLQGAEGTLRLVVRDYGIGIRAEDRSRIFERFERAVSDRHYGGFGLGLWRVRQIVQAMGGEIQVVSAPDRGSTFTVVLPRETAAPERWRGEGGAWSERGS